MPISLIAAQGRVLVGFVLIVEAIGKVLSSSNFVDPSTNALESDWLQGARTVVLAALPALELIVGFGMLMGVARGLTAGAAATMLLAFTGYLAWSAARAGRGSCHCFGELLGPTKAELGMARNIALLALTVLWLLFPDPALEWPGVDGNVVILVPTLVTASIVLAAYALLVRAFGLEITDIRKVPSVSLTIDPQGGEAK